MFTHSALGHLDFIGHFLPAQHAEQEIESIDANIRGFVVIFNRNLSTSPPDILAIKVVFGPIKESLRLLLLDPCVAHHLPQHFGYRVVDSDIDIDSMLSRIKTDFRPPCP